MRVSNTTIEECEESVIYLQALRERGKVLCVGLLLQTTDRFYIRETLINIMS